MTVVVSGGSGAVMPALPGRSRRPGAFGTLLRRERDRVGMTQAELADRAGLGERTVSNLERGINRAPYPSTVRLLADALGLSDASRGRLLAAARAGAGAGSPPSRPAGGYLGAVPPARLIARDAESARIAAAIAAAAAGAGRIVLLAGEAGIGKTRLAQEATIGAEERGFAVATGRCYEPLSGAPYTPFLEVLAGLYDTAPAGVRASLGERWPALATLLPDQFPAVVAARVRTPPEETHLLHRAVAGFVRELAGLRPVAVVFDDLHWADGASVGLLAHLARHTRADRVFLLGTYRTAEAAQTQLVPVFARSLRREGILETVTVGRLGRDATARLITDRLGGAPVSEEFSALIHRRTGGNPFFTVEVLAALIERGDLSRIDGRWVRRDLAELEPPASVSEAIGERVARLSPTARGLVETVSVLGEVFGVEDLAIVDAGETELEAAMDEAVASGLLTIAGGGYAFDHALTQQALYAALSPARRRRVHRRAAEVLEHRPPAARRRRSAEIARHLEAGGVPGRAVPYVLLAGDVAAGMHTHREALQHYRHGLELAGDHEDHAAAAAAHERLGQVLMTVASFDESAGHLARAADFYQLAADQGARLRVEGTIAQALFRRGSARAAAARLAGVLAGSGDSAAPGGGDPGVAMLYTGLARVRLALGEHELCREAAQRAARLARAQGLLAVEADAEAVRGLVLLFLDEPGEAVSTLEGAVVLAERAEAVTAQGNALMSLAWESTMRGKLARARAFIERGLQVNRRSGDRDAEALNEAGLGLNRFYAGAWAEAQAHLERGLELARAGGPTLFSGIPPAYLGLLRRGQGDLAAAAACYDEAAGAADLQTFEFAAYIEARRAELDLLRGDPAAALSRLAAWLDRQAPTRIHDVLLLSTAAEASLALGDISRGADLAGRALRRAAATRNEIDRTDTLRIKARCLLLRQRHQAARSCLDEALALARDMRYPAAEARVLHDLARMRAAGDRDAARQCAAAAYEIFGRLGAVHDAAAAAGTLEALESG
jgi:transcriptional regulator with XRE-family HTH domain/tetratricopeptide (TPR) repeat protein